jgi:hypothetical protein
MSIECFSHIDFIVKKFLFQFQKSSGRGTHSLAMADELMIVEEIEVPGPSGFSDGSVAAFEDAELETDVVST